MNMVSFYFFEIPRMDAVLVVDTSWAMGSPLASPVMMALGLAASFLRISRRSSSVWYFLFAASFSAVYFSDSLRMLLIRALLSAIFESVSIFTFNSYLNDSILISCAFFSIYFKLIIINIINNINILIINNIILI